MNRVFAWAAVALASVLALPAVAQDVTDPLKLRFTSDDGEVVDIVKAVGGDALFLFMDLEKVEEQDMDDMVEFLNGFATGLAEAAEAAGIEEPEIDLVLVILSDEDIWEQVKEAFGEEPPFSILVVPNDAEDLAAWELPEDLVWSAYLVMDSDVLETYDTLEAVQEQAEAIRTRLVPAKN